MPAKLDRCVTAVKKTAWCKRVKCNPFAVCKASLKKNVKVSKHKRGRSVVQSYSRRRPFTMKGWKRKGGMWVTTHKPSFNYPETTMWIGTNNCVYIYDAYNGRNLLRCCPNEREAQKYLMERAKYNVPNM